MSTVGLGFVIEVVSSRSGVWWADKNCNCTIDYTSLRPVGKASVHVGLHLEECSTSEVRVCGKKGTSYSDFAGSTGLRGHTANWVKFDAYILLWIGPGHVPQRYCSGFETTGYEERTL